MDKTIRNIDAKAYRQLKARAAVTGRGLGELVSEAIELYLRRPAATEKTGSLIDLVPEPYGPGTERLSEEIDREVYGA